MQHVAVLVQRGEVLGAETLLAALAQIWVESGVRVSVIDDPDALIAADLLILHVSFTEVPAEYLRAIERVPVVINRGVVDISKRRISRNLVRRGDSYSGPVIVKTNRNFRGVIESVNASRGHPVRGAVDAIRNHLPWSLRSKLDEYPVLGSSRDVPLGVWYNRDLVVERFLAERRDGYYCLRTWLFLGDQERMALFHSNDPVVKSHNIVGRERLEEVPEDLRAMRRELAFDFGKFDFAVVDGRTVLYDANRTPSLGAISREEALPWLRLLASGLSSYLRKPSAP